MWETGKKVRPLKKKCNDYYSFGMLQPGRNANSPDYRYGFNGMEKDDEVKGNGNSLDFGARIYDPRIGRWLVTDPHDASYPHFSPYTGLGNNPIIIIDPDGRDIWVFHEDGSWSYEKTPGATKFYLVDNEGKREDIYSVGNWLLSGFAFFDSPDEVLAGELYSRPEALAFFEVLYPKHKGMVKIMQNHKNAMIVVDVATIVVSLPSFVRGVYKGGRFIFTAVKHGRLFRDAVVTAKGVITIENITYESVKAFEQVTALELDFLSYANKSGKAVRVLERLEGSKTADFLIDGLTWELKTIENISSKNVIRAVKDRILAGKKQSKNIVADVRNLEGFNLEMAHKAAQSAFKQSSKPQKIRMIGEGFDITYER